MIYPLSPCPKSSRGLVEYCLAGIDFSDVANAGNCEIKAYKKAISCSGDMVFKLLDGKYLFGNDAFPSIKYETFSRPRASAFNSSRGKSQRVSLSFSSFTVSYSRINFLPLVVKERQ